MASIQQERIVVSEMYDGRHWKRKVDQMPDHQIHAIYMRHVERQEENLKKKDEQQDFGF